MARASYSSLQRMHTVIAQTLPEGYPRQAEIRYGTLDLWETIDVGVALPNLGLWTPDGTKS